MAGFLNSYPSPVAEIVQRLRQIIAIPDAREKLDPSDRVIGYELGHGYAGLICTIIPSQKGVKLGIVCGAHLPDARRFLGRLRQAPSLHTLESHTISSYARCSTVLTIITLPSKRPGRPKFLRFFK